MAASAQAALNDILEAIVRIERYVFDADPGLLRLPRLNFEGVLFNILIISEASRQLPDEMKASRPDISWRDIAAIGNTLRHRYFKIDRKVIADIVAHDLPALQAALERMWRDLGYGELPKFS